MKILEVALFFIASLITIVVIHLQFPTNLLQKINACFILLLLLLSRFAFNPQNVKLESYSRLVLIFLSALLVQFLVISSGGIYSPFLISLHIYTLGTSFLLS